MSADRIVIRFLDKGTNRLDRFFTPFIGRTIGEGPDEQVLRTSEGFRVYVPGEGWFGVWSDRVEVLEAKQ